MKNVSSSVLLIALGSTFLFSPLSFAQVPVTQDHKPNEHTIACLEAPTRDCAFKAAIQTVIAEEFGIQRAKVLIGVARSMIATGDKTQAVQTLMLALDEARSVRLSLVTQEKITAIAPLLARGGDTASALAIAGELNNSAIKDAVLFRIAQEAANTGAIADARVALRQMKNQRRAFWAELSILSSSPAANLVGLDIGKVEIDVRAAEKVTLQYRGLILLAIFAEKTGRVADRDSLIIEADELFPSVIGLYSRADVTAERLRNMYDAGLSADLIAQSYDLALIHGDRLRGNEPLANFAGKVGIVESAHGKLEAALARLDYFEEIEAKAAYLSGLRGGENSNLAIQVRDVLKGISDVDGAYERDLIRLTLLEGALGNTDLYLARNIVEAIEDDDNQAYGLALLAPLLD